MFTLTIETDNDAFDPAGFELARILRMAAAELENGMTANTAKDANGNTVGRWELEAGSMLEHIDRDGARFEEQLGRVAHELADAIVNPTGYADDPAESNRRSLERDRLEAIARRTLESELLG